MNSPKHTLRPPFVYNRSLMNKTDMQTVQSDRNRAKFDKTIFDPVATENDGRESRRTDTRLGNNQSTRGEEGQSAS